MFVQITDPDKALALYQAGLLWEKHLYVEEYQLALGWYKNKHGMMRDNILSSDPPCTGGGEVGRWVHTHNYLASLRRAV